MALLAASALFARDGLNRQQPPGQPPQSPQRVGTGFISGQVIEAGTGQFAAGALVQLNGRGVAPQRVLVDPRGRFFFRGLPAGPFAVSATKLGFFGGGAGVRQPTGVAHAVELADGERLSDLTLRLWKSGVITGTVTDDAGDPVAGAEVRAFRRSLVGGTWQLADAGTVATDDRGRYRLVGLTPGNFAVVVIPDPNPETSLLSNVLFANPNVALDVLAGTTTAGQELPTLDALIRRAPVTFYGASKAAAGATLLGVRADQERTAIDIRVMAVRGVRVRGTLVGTHGFPEDITIRLVPAAAEAAGLGALVDAGVAGCDASGRFEFTGVTPGRYVVKVLRLAPLQQTGANPNPGPAPGGAQGPAPGGARQGGPAVPQPGLIQMAPTDPVVWASAPVTVGNQDVSALSVPLHRGVSVGGRVTFEGAAVPPNVPAPLVSEALAQVSVWLEPANTSTPREIAGYRWRIGPDGRFHTMGVPPGRYFLRTAGTPRGWLARSAMSAGRDVLDAPLQIAATDVSDVVLDLTNRPLAVVAGTVRNDRGAAEPDALVMLFPSDRQLWMDSSAAARRLKIASVMRDGSFTLPGVPDGDYLIAAVIDIDIDINEAATAWQDPKRLASLASRATPVRATSGELRTIDVKVIKP